MRGVPVITGIGVVSPLGNNIPEFWQRLRSGTQGFSDIPYFDASQYRNTKAGVVSDVEGSDKLGRGCAYALGAAREAIGDAGLDRTTATGIVCASNFGVSAQPEGDRFAPVTAALCEELNAAGPAITLSLSCASGAAAIACAADQIVLGRASAVVVVGYEELSELWYSGLSALRAITTDTIRPFDAQRSGTLFGEGSGAVVLEDERSALDRGAEIYARVAGYEMNNDAYHMTAPDPQGTGSRRAIEQALKRAAIQPERVDYVNAHGTGTEYNDKTETLVLKAAMGDHAYRIPVVSIKSMLSHMMGAAGIVETISCVLSMRDGIIPRTVGLENPDPECDLDYAASGCVEKDVGVALSNSAGIGGTNCAIVMTKPGGVE